MVLENDEIAAARGSRPKVIELEHFVETAQIDPIFYNRPYILGAQPGGERAYRVLLAALERSEKVGIGRFTMRTREQLVALGPRSDALELYTMRFADEVVDRDQIEVPALRRAPAKQEIEMAERLIDSLTGDWNPSEYEDRYRSSVLELIQSKAAGKDIEPPTPQPAKPRDDLLAALQESLDAQPHRRSLKLSRKRTRGHADRTGTRS